MRRFGYLLPTRGSVLGSDDAGTLAAKTAADVVGLARRAEAAGFGSVWVGDSVLAKPRHEPLTTLAAVATATESVDLGTAVYLPPLRHPVHVAHAAATVDQLSGGRLRLGVGVGIGEGVREEYGSLGVPFTERGPRLDEALDVMTKLWRGETVDHDGPFHALEGASLGFQPVREPPVYVATGGLTDGGEVPGAIRSRLAEHATGWLPIGLTPEEYADALAAIRDDLADAGRSGDDLDPALYRDVVVDPDEERALATARRFYGRYYPDWGELTPAFMRAHGTFGAPADVAAELSAYAEAGVETFVVRFTARDQRTQLSRFVDAVA